MAENRRFGRLASEAVVITASILLAFALDAWWERSQEREQGLEVRAALATEFDAVERELRRARDVHERRISAAQNLIRLAETGAELPAADSLAALMEAARTPTTIDPPGTVLDGAISTGVLAFIEGDSVGALLAGWKGMVEDHRKTEDNVRSYAFEILLPWQAERGLTAPLTSDWGPWMRRMETAIRDPAFAGHLWMMARNGALRREGDELMLTAREIGRLLRDERF